MSLLKDKINLCQLIRSPSKPGKQTRLSARETSCCVNSYPIYASPSLICSSPSPGCLRGAVGPGCGSPCGDEAPVCGAGASTQHLQPWPCSALCQGTRATGDTGSSPGRCTAAPWAQPNCTNSHHGGFGLAGQLPGPGAGLWLRAVLCTAQLLPSLLLINLLFIKT